MRKLIKLFAIWLIAIAIPVQGFASIAMMNCEQSSSHQSKSVAAAAGHDHDHHSGHDISSHHSNDAVDSDNHTAQKIDKTKHSCAHCVKCASCCLGFTFQTTSSSPIRQLNAAKVTFSDNTLIFTGFIPSGLERPPRFTLV